MANNAHSDINTTFSHATHSAASYQPLPLPSLDSAAPLDAAYPLTLDDAAAAPADYSFLDSDDFTFTCDDVSDNSWMQLVA